MLIIAFAVPIALALLFLLYRWRVSPWSRPPWARNQMRRLILECGAGLALLAYTAWQVPDSSQDEAANRAAWGCQQGTQTATGSTLPNCSVHKASLSEHAIGEGPGATYFLDVDAPDMGPPQSARISPTQQNLLIFNEAKNRPGMLALAQFDNGRVVLVSTDLGIADTEHHPEDRVFRQEILAVLGAGLIAASLLELLLGKFMLPDGW